MTQRLGWVLWPAFLIAGVADGVIFSMFDPEDLRLFGEPVELSRIGVYTIGFFLFWGLGAASSALTCMLQCSPFEVNRCPLQELDRPEGCPKRGQLGQHVKRH